ncbi:hypothetical protein RSA30_05790 [Pantoea stewartii]|uniref:Inner membrane protein n=1 Tax=Pantoea stewartii TaxID=66269 RepID=A0AB34VGU1_9GAMM|nr:hypothetical protein RSA30_05790 [Pantoea stewartii]KTS98041.1 hypothetical protein RSA13_10520 [Pantoea stewartii]
MSNKHKIRFFFGILAFLLIVVSFFIDFSNDEPPKPSHIALLIIIFVAMVFSIYKTNNMKKDNE